MTRSEAWAVFAAAALTDEHGNAFWRERVTEIADELTVEWSRRFDLPEDRVAHIEVNP